MSGPLPQYRRPTMPTDEVKGYKTVVDKVLPPRKGERSTYTYKEVPVYKHKSMEQPAQRPSKHRNGRMTPERRTYEAFVSRIQKKVTKALDWMKENDKGWQAAVDEGFIPEDVANNMGLLNGPA